jgi:hypothetical protein
VDLGVAVVAGGDTVVGAGVVDLLELQSAVLTPGIGKSGLQKPAAAAAAEIVGPVRCHIDEILFPDTGLHHESQVLGNRVAQGFAHQLTGVLDGKFDLQIPVPVAADLQFSLANPTGVILDDALDLEIV